VIIEGLGPTIARLLQDIGIRTFADLAATTPENLKTLLASVGARLRLADPATWPERAQFAASGDSKP
jgi:predicted flap endonuclease-1-like 5' DNA nuclease